MPDPDTSLSHIQGSTAAERRFWKHYASMRILGRRTVEQAWRAGEALTEVKAAMPHGAWLPWLEANDLPVRTAQRLMELPVLYPKCDNVVAFETVQAALEAAKPEPEPWETPEYRDACQRARDWWRTCMDGMPEDDPERSALVQSCPDGPLSAAAWTDFGVALENANEADDYRAAWELRPWAPGHMDALRKELGN